MRRRHAWVASAFVVLGAFAIPLPGCNSDSPDEGAAGSGGLAWSSSSSASGEGGASTAASGGTGGDGGAPSTASSSGGDSTSASTSTSGGQGGEASATTASSAAASSGSGSGGGSSGRALLLTGGSSSLVAAVGDGGAWTSTVLMSATNRGIAIAAGTSNAMGVWREAASGALHYALFDGSAWGSATPVGPGVTTQGGPSIVSRGTAFDVAFHGDNFKHYFGSHSGQWSPSAEEVKPLNQGQSFGPVPGAVAATGNELVFAFPGGDGVLYEQSRINGTWQPASAHAGTSTAAVAPALVSPAAGSELLVVYANGGDNRLRFATRSNGMWSAPATVHADAYSNDPPALAALPGGAVFLAFRGTDGKPYTCRYDANGNPPWSQPKPIAANNPSLKSAPAVASGINGHDVEMAYVASDGSAYHTSLSGTTWSPATAVAGPGLLHVAIATQP